jgi:hypothetical protein
MNPLIGYHPPKRATQWSLRKVQSYESSDWHLKKRRRIKEPQSTETTVESLPKQYHHRPISKGCGKPLLCLTTSSSADDICRSLHDVEEEEEDIWCFDELTSRILYEALSYCWGPESARHRRLIEDKSFYIRSNLYHALRRILSETRSILILLDSVCINQSDDEEKSAQVKSMDRFFYRARSVLIWLGEADEDSDYAIDYIAKLVDPKNKVRSPRST